MARSCVPVTRVEAELLHTKVPLSRSPVETNAGLQVIKNHRKKRWKWLSIGVVVGLLGINAGAWLHARAMTTWSSTGSRTERPEDLGWTDKLRVLVAGVSIPRPTNQRTPLDRGLDFETHRFANGVGAELEAWRVPAGSAETTSILFHGYAGQKDSMLGVAEGMVALGSSVLLVDFYGSGGSSGSGTTIGMRESHDVKAAVDYCRANWPGQRILLYGQSMGGAAVLRAIAELGVEPDAVVLESTFDRFFSTVASRFHRMRLPATPLAHLLVFWGGVSLGADAFAHNPVDYARSVRCPALILQGDRDPNVSLEQARSIQASTAGWNRFSVYTKTGHQDVRSADAGQWDADLRAILAVL